jgi:tripartite ATP-independent transporter DctP family solute receptor
MTGMTRRGLIAASSAGVLAGVSGRQAKAAEFNYKLASDMPPTDPMNLRFATAVKEIERESGGRLVIRVFPSGQLGTISEELNQVRSGALEFYCCGYGNQIPVAPLAGINSLAFAWSGYDKVWPAMDGELGAFLAAEVAKTGTIQHVSKAFDVGFRQTTSGHKVIEFPADMKGFKVRVPPAPMLATLFTALGASPVNLSYGELYQALQTGLVEGSDNPLWVLSAMRVYEVQKHVSMTNHSWDAFVTVANSRAWARLPAELQQIATKHFNEAAVGQREDVAKLEAEAATKLEASGMTIHRPPPGLFRSALMQTDYYTTWRDKIGPEAWAVLQRATGLQELG